MGYFNVCPKCGANLDPGERCDCVKEQEKKKNRLSAMFRQGPDGQMEIGGLYVSEQQCSGYFTGKI